MFEYYCRIFFLSSYIIGLFQKKSLTEEMMILTCIYIFHEFQVDQISLSLERTVLKLIEKVTSPFESTVALKISMESSEETFQQLSQLKQMLWTGNHQFMNAKRQFKWDFYLIFVCDCVQVLFSFPCVFLIDQ